MRKAFTLIELLVVIAIIAVLCGCLLGPGGFDALYRILFGWVLYPLRLAGERDIDWRAVLLCLACLAGLTVGVHYFGRWFASHRAMATDWPWSAHAEIDRPVDADVHRRHRGHRHHARSRVAGDEQGTIDHKWRGLSARIQSIHNLKVIALACHDRHDRHKQLPAGGTFDVNGRSLHGWQTAILPWVDQAELHKQIDLKLPWNDPKNAEAMKKEIYVFLHPTADATPIDGNAVSHYTGNVHVLGVKPMKLDDITDGQSNTLFFGEIAHDFKPWGMPMNCRDPVVGLNVPHGFGNPQGKEVVFALADGSVRTFRGDISPAVLKALSTPRGGEREPMPD